jgi:hypothetical protein
MSEEEEEKFVVEAILAQRKVKVRTAEFLNLDLIFGRRLGSL